MIKASHLIALLNEGLARAYIGVALKHGQHDSMIIRLAGLARARPTLTAF